MVNSIITVAGAELIAQKQAKGEALKIDKMIFADIQNLDTSQAPSSKTVLPPKEQIVFEAAVQAQGLVNEKTVVYSKILPVAVGTFYLNWLGLYASKEKVLLAVCHTPRHLKYASTSRRLGNILCKNFALQINNVSNLTGINVEAKPWQWQLEEQFEPLGKVKRHEAVKNPHPQYSFATHDHKTTYEPINSVAAHEAKANPHPQYWLPPGSIIAMAAATVPAGFLECNGAAVSRISYAALFAAIGATYGQGNGSTTFNLPDLRGEFLRGWDHARGVDAKRKFGSFQHDAFQDHVHPQSYHSRWKDIKKTFAGGGWKYQLHGLSDHDSTGWAGHDSCYRTAAETRPRNVVVMYCIKY